MVEVIITYETLYEILRREKGRSELQNLDKNFFKDVSDYIKEKQDFVKSREGQTSMFDNEISRIKKEIENIKRIVKELYDRRELKIINIALARSITGSEQMTESMLDEEKNLYNALFKELSCFRKDILMKIINGGFEDKPKAIKSEDSPISNSDDDIKGSEIAQDGLSVRFVKSVPKFGDEKGNVYGPFESDDIAELPKKVAELLLKNERVELI